MSKLENVMNHFKNNKVTYIACSVTAVVVAGVTYYVVRNPIATTEIVNTKIVQDISQKFNWKSNQVIVNLVENSTPSTAVALVDEDGLIKQVFSSINEAARATGLSRTSISKVVNGVRDEVKGMKFSELKPEAVAA